MAGLVPGAPRPQRYGEGWRGGDAGAGVATLREALGDRASGLPFHHAHHEERLRKGGAGEEEEEGEEVEVDASAGGVLLLLVPLASLPGTPAVGLSQAPGTPGVAWALDAVHSGGATRPTSGAVIVSAAPKS